MRELLGLGLSLGFFDEPMPLSGDAGKVGDGNLLDELMITRNPFALKFSQRFNVWEYLRKNKLANRLYETYEDIVEVCCDAWNSLMAMPDRIASIAARTWAKAS